MIEHIRYKKIRNEGFFHVNSDELSSDISFVRENEIKNVIINFKSEYKLHNIDFLSELPDVEKLVVTTSNKNFCLEGLKFCSNLLELKVNNFSNSIVDLVSNKAVEVLFVENFSKIKSIETCTKLRSFVTGKLPKTILNADFWKVFCDLEYLCVSNTHHINSMDFLRGINVKKIFFYSCKNLNFLEMENLSVEDLKVEKCINAINVDEIFKNENIKSLALIDSFCVKKADLVFEMHNLERLIILGKSHFINGDLSVIKDRFKVFSHDNKKHYKL